MSLILGYANKKNAIIMSDGRAGINGAYSEKFNKTKKINDNIIIGFAGIKERIDIFLSHILREMGRDIQRYNINDFLEMIDFYMKDEQTQQHLSSSFLIIGRNNTGEMVTAIGGQNTNFEIEKHLVTSVRYLSIGGIVNEKIIEEIFTKNISRTDIPIIDCMKNTIMQVSEIDDSVNSNFFYSLI